MSNDKFNAHTRLSVKNEWGRKFLYGDDVEEGKRQKNKKYIYIVRLLMMIKEKKENQLYNLSYRFLFSVLYMVS